MKRGDKLLTHLMALGVRMHAIGGVLRIHAPKGVMTPDLLHRCKERKGELLAAVQQSKNDASPPTPGNDQPLLAPPPRDRPGLVTELVLRRGRFIWRQRPEDAADRAFRASVLVKADPPPPDPVEAIHEWLHRGGTETSVRDAVLAAANIAMNKPVLPTAIPPSTSIKLAVKWLVA